MPEKSGVDLEYLVSPSVGTVIMAAVSHYLRHYLFVEPVNSNPTIKPVRVRHKLFTIYIALLPVVWSTVSMRPSSRGTLCKNVFLRWKQ